MTAETDFKAKFPLPGWFLALVVLGFGGGGAVAGVRGLTTADSNSERVRALEVRAGNQEQQLERQEKQLEKMDAKLDRVLDELRRSEVRK